MPVLLALLVTWGSLRAVLLSCALWYGGLGLIYLLMTMSAPAGQGAFFSLFTGLFFSIVGVPILALVIRVILALRRWITAARAARRPGMAGHRLVEATKAAGVRGWIAGAAFIAVLLYFPLAKTDAGEDVLRATFRLPQDARIEDVKRPASYRDGSVVEGTVQFGADEYARYRAAVQDPAVWRPLTLGRDGRTIANTGDAALQSWQPIDMANPNGDAASVRSLYNAELNRLQITEGLVLCFVVDRTDPTRAGNARTLSVDDLAVLPCAALPNGGGTHALFLGVLDDQTERLLMKVQHLGLLDLTP